MSTHMSRYMPIGMPTHTETLSKGLGGIAPDGLLGVAVPERFVGVAVPDCFVARGDAVPDCFVGDALSDCCALA